MIPLSNFRNTSSRDRQAEYYKNETTQEIRTRSTSGVHRNHRKQGGRIRRCQRICRTGRFGNVPWRNLLVPPLYVIAQERPFRTGCGATTRRSRYLRRGLRVFFSLNCRCHRSRTQCQRENRLEKRERCDLKTIAGSVVNWRREQPCLSTPTLKNCSSIN